MDNKLQFLTCLSVIFTRCQSTELQLLMTLRDNLVFGRKVNGLAYKLKYAYRYSRKEKLVLYSVSHRLTKKRYQLTFIEKDGK